MEKPVNILLKHLGRTDHLQLTQFQNTLKQRMDMVTNTGIFCPCSQCFLFLHKTLMHYKRSTGCHSICLHIEFEADLCLLRPSKHFHTSEKKHSWRYFHSPNCCSRITSAAINHDIESDNFTSPLEVWINSSSLS